MKRHRHGKNVFFTHASRIARKHISKRRGKLLSIFGELGNMLTTAIGWSEITFTFDNGSDGWFLLIDTVVRCVEEYIVFLVYTSKGSWLKDI